MPPYWARMARRGYLGDDGGRRPLLQRRALLEEFDEGGGGGHLADPEEEHPLDDLGLGIGDLHTELGSILFGHEGFGEVQLVFLEGQCDTFRNGASLGRFDAGCFEDREDFDRAHEDVEWWKVWGMSRGRRGENEEF